MLRRRPWGMDYHTSVPMGQCSTPTTMCGQRGYAQMLWCRSWDGVYDILLHLEANTWGRFVTNHSRFARYYRPAGI